MSELPRHFTGYRVTAALRSGPVADQFIALQEPLGRPVLIKALSSAILPSSPFAATLEREAHVLADLDDPHVLRLLDFRRDSDRMWLVLEHVDGWELAELMAEPAQSSKPSATKSPSLYGPRALATAESEAAPRVGRRVSAAGAVGVALQIASALRHAHARGVLHRDLQPHTVLVSRSGAVKVTGFSQHYDESPGSLPEALDTSGARSAAYLSPEQILGEPADPRGDFFSLGVLLYQMTTGVAPFGAPGDPGAAQRVRHDTPAPLSRYVPHVSGALERVVARCLEKMPSDRFQSADELIVSLQSLLAELGHAAPVDAVHASLSELGLTGDATADSPPPPSAQPGWEDAASTRPLARGSRRLRGGAASDPPARPASAGRRGRTAALPEAAHGAGAHPWYGLFVALGLMVVGGAIIQLVAARTDASGARENRALELVPEQAAALRVVATPWAHVFVDGEQVATTPFAEPIPLRPGLHYVRLDHPQAPSEERTLRLAPGESLLLDVTMAVVRPPEPEVAPAPPEDDSP